MSIRDFSMTRANIRKAFKCAAPLMLALLGFGWSGRAATVTWVGNAGTNWNLAANWSGAGVPAPNDSLAFPNAGTAGASLNNDLPAGRTFNGVTFVTGATNAFTFSGNAFGLNGTIANSSAGIQTINNAIILAANGTITASATNIVLGGPISDAGSSFGLTLGGGKTVVLSGANTFGGTLAINSGTTLSFGAANNLGAGTNITFGGSSSSTLSEEAPQASERQLEQEIVYEKLPSDIAERYVLLMDPILASGNSAARAIQVRGRGRAGQRRCFG